MNQRVWSTHTKVLTERLHSQKYMNKQKRRTRVTDKDPAIVCNQIYNFRVN